MDEIN